MEINYLTTGLDVRTQRFNFEFYGQLIYDNGAGKIEEE